MTIDFMRRLDYWVGIPLCFLLTLVNLILRLFSSEKTGHNAPKKILFIKPSELGGILLSDPLMHQVKKEYPKAEIFFVIFAANKPLFDVLDHVPGENVITICDRSFPGFIRDVVKAIFRLRKEKIDASYDLEFFSRFTAILSYLSGASKRIGFYRYTFEGLYRGGLLTHKIQYNPHVHIADLFLSMGLVLKDPKKDTPEYIPDLDHVETALPQFIPIDDQKKKVLKKLEELKVPSSSRLFLVNPGEGRLPLREWPLDNFIALVRRLLENGNNYVVLVGTDECFYKAEKLLQEALQDKRCIDLSGKTSIQELLTLFTMADALITNDSGLAHLASMTEIQQFVFFGPESPRVFSPLGNNVSIFYSSLPCSPCLSAYNHRKSACRDNKCLQAISFQEVYDALSKKELV